MKKIAAIKKVPYLFSILCLALGALITLQIVWMMRSKQLIEEQFDQRVNLAIGSAVTEYNAKNNTSLSREDFTVSSLYQKDPVCVPRTSVGPGEEKKLEACVRGQMACFGIDENYSVEIASQGTKVGKGTYSCSLGNTDGFEQTATLGVSFGSREDYLYDQMSPMIISSLLVFILLATVSFLILGSLIKQKRITANNIDFFNNAAHELKTPLTNISLALRLLTKKHPAVSDSKYVSIIEAENARLTDQIERVLLLSKIENGEYTLEKEALDVRSLLAEVVETMSLAVQEREGNIRLEVNADSPTITGDRYHLSNVFRNLIDNAIKYCAGPPEILISVQEDDQNIRVTFSDNGIGISPQDQQHIFEKFQRVNTGNVRQSKGFGIGLSYVKTVVELHKGLVQVQSELHKGSQFQLLIPQA